MDYAELQKLYKRDRTKAFKRIFQSTSVSESLSSRDVFRFWEHFLTITPFVEGELPNNEERVNSEDARNLAEFVIVEEVAKAYPPNKTAVGVDSIDTKCQREVSSACVGKNVYSLVQDVLGLPVHPGLEDHFHP